MLTGMSYQKWRQRLEVVAGWKVLGDVGVVVEGMEGLLEVAPAQGLAAVVLEGHRPSAVLGIRARAGALGWVKPGADLVEEERPVLMDEDKQREEDGEE